MLCGAAEINQSIILCIFPLPFQDRVGSRESLATFGPHAKKVGRLYESPAGSQRSPEVRCWFLATGLDKKLHIPISIL